MGHVLAPEPVLWCVHPPRTEHRCISGHPLTFHVFFSECRPADTACPALNDDGNADWNVGTAGINTGTCEAGYYVSASPYSPQRQCTASGWGDISPPCQRTTHSSSSLRRSLACARVYTG